MRRGLMLLFVLLAAIAVAAGCGGGHLGFAPSTGVSNAGKSPRNPIIAHRRIRMLFAGYSMKKHKVVSMSLGWSDAQSLRVAPLAKSTPTPVPSWSPEPTPTPGFGLGCSYTGTVCMYLNPGGDELGEALWCTDCTSGTFSATYGITDSYTPPPDFSATGDSSTNPTPMDCTTTCGLTTCWQPWPTCWVQVVMDADYNTPPANTDSHFGPTPGTGWTNFLTINPSVSDLDLVNVIPNIVSYPGPITNTFPSPIMVGQQVQLQASPAPSVTGVQWTFDSTAAPDVVASSFVQNVSVVGTPEPVATSGSAITFYWTSSHFPGGIRHVRMTAQASDVTGPLFADVYYPVGTPSPLISYTTSSVQVSNDTVGASGTQCGAPLTTFVALHLGIPCSATTPTPAPGIMMNYSVTMPAYGAGQIAVAQLISETFSGKQGSSPVPTYTTGATPVLDTQFPLYGFATPAATGTAQIPDSPFYNLTRSSCTSVTMKEVFRDYFMYQPTPTSSRPSIWVTDDIWTWGWTGTATLKSGSWSRGTYTNPSPAQTSPPITALPAWNAWLQAANQVLPC
jgi:hypothetical protein